MPADAPELLALQRLAYETEARLYDDWRIPPLTQTLEELRAEFGRLVILKAMAGGRVVGSVRAGMAEKDCRIGRLMVHPEHRRQGLGAALLAAVEAAFPRARRWTLFTGHKSLDNLRLYQRLGYVPTGRAPAGPGLVLVTLKKPNPACAG